MPTTLTLKNIPDEVYDRLKAPAEAHRRSLNSEAIVCLESVLLPRRVDAGRTPCPGAGTASTAAKTGFTARTSMR